MKRDACVLVDLFQGLWSIHVFHLCPWHNHDSRRKNPFLDLTYFHAQLTPKCNNIVRKITKFSVNSFRRLFPTISLHEQQKSWAR